MVNPVSMSIEARHFYIEELFELVWQIAFYMDDFHLLRPKMAEKNNKEKKAGAETVFVVSFLWNCLILSFVDFHTFCLNYLLDMAINCSVGLTTDSLLYVDE